MTDSSIEKTVILEGLKKVGAVRMVSRSEYHSPTHPVRFNCVKHAMRHPSFKMSPQEALDKHAAGGHICPMCESVARDEVVSFAELNAAWIAHQKATKKAVDKARSKAHRPGRSLSQYSL